MKSQENRGGVCKPCMVARPSAFGMPPDVYTPSRSDLGFYTCPQEFSQLYSSGGHQTASSRWTP